MSISSKGLGPVTLVACPNLKSVIISDTSEITYLGYLRYFGNLRLHMQWNHAKSIINDDRSLRGYEFRTCTPINF